MRIVVFFLFISSIAYGQNRIEPIEEIPFESLTEYQRLIIEDTTLLFFTKEYVWNCDLTNGKSSYYHESSVQDIKGCYCSKETYQKVPSLIGVSKIPYSYYFDKLSEVRKAELIRTSENEFKYYELDAEGKKFNIKTISYDSDNVLSSDTSFTEDLYTGNWHVDVSKLIKTVVTDLKTNLCQKWYLTDSKVDGHSLEDFASISCPNICFKENDEMERYCEELKEPIKANWKMKDQSTIIVTEQTGTSTFITIESIADTTLVLTYESEIGKLVNSYSIR
jgi:hypothetical protein